MKPVYTFTDSDRDSLKESLEFLGASPYEDYEKFSDAIAALIAEGRVPDGLTSACRLIRGQREARVTYAHVISNSPLDSERPVFDQSNPVDDKYLQKRTFVGEGMLELVGRLTGTPLLSYATRNNGDFFHDVYADNRYAGTQTQKTDWELHWHNDRTAHPVRADYLALLGMRCPTKDLVYTKYVDGRELLKYISPRAQELLRRPEFVTPYDELSRDSNKGQRLSEAHAVLENEHSFRYYDTRTEPADRASAAHYEALREFRDALAKCREQYHRIQDGDLLVIANQDGLHSRQMIDIQDAGTTRLRWLLKTYAFRDDATADVHANDWLDGVRGRVRD
ncbi:taurine catabolism dioxygenase TauD [Streptomyces sp. SID8379]|uniref:TauD/TfdA family dioxygenase n=1 Tax=unclassified Streptomyces TaxID=2593676 RepID=UPI0003794B96|nr:MULTISPECIES: TauD/TfdA family dioxygenase [unclassified Streptomyces]MYW69312.1 taurine catabolism dioxygenase TauD [Streptomyces sp. SID8379]